MKVAVDMTGLNVALSGLRRTLTAAGSPGSMSQILRNECGQLAWDIANALPPRTLGAANKELNRNLKAVLTDKPEHENIPAESQLSTIENMTWLNAGPVWLVGINDYDDMVGHTAPEARRVYGRRRKEVRGVVYKVLGFRKHQKVMQINRVRVTRPVFAEVRAMIAKNFGQLKASFARTSAAMSPMRSLPRWLAAQIPNVVANSKSILIDAGLSNGESPSVAFGSRSKGVESNPKLVRTIQGAVRKRERITLAKIKKIMTGYVYQWNTGQVFRPIE